MELYGSRQSCQYIERFTTLLSKGLVCLWLRSTEATGGCDSPRCWVGGRQGKVSLRHAGRQQTEGG